MFHDFSRTLLTFSLLVLANYTVFPIFSFDYSPIFLVLFFAALVFQKNYATVASLSFIILGLAGLPCFSFGSGLSYVQEPSFAYIVSLIPFSISVFMNKTNKILLSFVILHFSANFILIITGNFNPYQFIDLSIIQLFFDLLLTFFILWISRFSINFIKSR